MKFIALCVFFMAGIAAYFPTIYIRKTNKMIRLLEQIAGASERK